MLLHPALMGSLPRDNKQQLIYRHTPVSKGSRVTQSSHFFPSTLVREEGKHTSSRLRVRNPKLVHREPVAARGKAGSRSRSSHGLLVTLSLYRHITQAPGTQARTVVRSLSGSWFPRMLCLYPHLSHMLLKKWFLVQNRSCLVNDSFLLNLDTLGPTLTQLQHEGSNALQRRACYLELM